MIVLHPSDAEYPSGLRDLGAPPDPLWVDGDPGALAARCVAVVGTRRMTSYGERVAREIGASCGAAGVTVISGLAQGVDSAAHRGALDAGGRTVAVVGAGLEAFVRSVAGRRRLLVHLIRESGALVSEYPPGAAARGWTFAKRNATIAALAEGVVIVEAGERSGALITAADALRLGRPLYAVPGPLGSEASVGTNALIARGDARALVRADAILEAFGVSSSVPTAPADPVLEALAGGAMDVDMLGRRLRMDAGRLASALAALVLHGRVEHTADGRFRRV